LEKEKALHEHAEARQIQRALLPAQEPLISGYAVDGFSVAIERRGEAIWYDYLNLAMASGDRARRRLRQRDGGGTAHVGDAQSVSHGGGGIALPLGGPYALERGTSEGPA